MVFCKAVMMRKLKYLSLRTYPRQRYYISNHICFTFRAGKDTYLLIFVQLTAAAWNSNDEGFYKKDSILLPFPFSGDWGFRLRIFPNSNQVQ